MTQEEKQLLLKDLSARLPYGVKVTWDGKHPLTVTPHIYCAIISEDNINNLPKLLLRPMSSMTPDEFEEFTDIVEHVSIGKLQINIANPEVFDFLNAHYFDYRGLIKKGLAIAVTEDNNPYKL